MSINKIKLTRDGGPIVFFGSMNAMPMMYALELRKMGYPVLYFVDANKDNLLSRPENHFADISYPYPSWIQELKIGTQMLIPFVRRLMASILNRKIRGFTQKKPQVYILNGFFITLAPFFKEDNNSLIALSHGSDLHTWGDCSSFNNLKNSFTKSSFFKYLPSKISSKLITLVINKQFNGLKKSDKVVYFPKLFNSAGDRVVSALEESGVTCHERYDVSFEPLKFESRVYKKPSHKLVIFSGVRFLYSTFLEGNESTNKGNDIMIQGISLFFKKNKNLEIHFVEKGPDVENAKLLCNELGISNIVTWHKEMKFKDLLKLYKKSDICFDQVGNHWVAAIGGYALWLGKPLIANVTLPVSTGVWPQQNPVLNASTPIDVFNALIKLQDSDFREQISIESKVFAEKHFSPLKLLNDIFDTE